VAHKLQTIAVSRLLLDQSNARLGEEQPNQQATQLALATLVAKQLLEIAADIAEFGLDPTALMAATPEGAPSGKLRVIEGNRRLLAVKAMETPAIVESALAAAQKRRLSRLSEQFSKSPISSIPCVVFDQEEEARRWIELRHTGANDGVGLVEWDSNEQDRYRSRHGSAEDRRPAGQIIDFVSKVYPPNRGDKKIFTTLARIISTRAVRERLGIEIDGGLVYSFYPASEVLKGLSTVVRDFRSGDRKVSDVYYEDQRIDYVNGFSPDQLPAPASQLASRELLTRLTTPSPLGVEGRPPGATQDLPAGAGVSPTSSRGQPSTIGTGSAGAASSGGSSPPAGGVNAASRASRVKPPRRRTTTIPSNCILWISVEPRINALYHELVRLDVDQFTNACAVLLRVFVELSADHHVAKRNLIPEAQRRSTSLAKKLKELASHMQSQGEIDSQLQRAVEKIADGSNLMSASTITFNQYVHNKFAYPQPTELCTAWDELQPFVQTLWKK
jgi:hypothetical protein